MCGAITPITKLSINQTQSTSILSLKQPNELLQLFGFQGKNYNDNFR